MADGVLFSCNFVSVDFNMTSRAWCFTRNCRDESLIEEVLLHLQASIEDAVETNKVRFAVFQHERGENGTNHFQGYIVFKNAVRMTGVKNIVGQMAHVETRQGTHDQARDYCTKEDSRVAGPWTYGEDKECGQGKRSDMLALKKLIDEGKSELEIADTMFGQWARSYKAIERYKRLKISERTWEMEVHVYVGVPGSGKSRRARDENPGAYWKQRSQWWCGYEGHDCVVLDDYYGWLPFDVLLRICDRYPLLVESKGGQIAFVAKKIVITSNKGPLEWYQEMLEKKKIDMGAFVRRVTKWVYYRAGGITCETPDYEVFTAALAMANA